MQIIVQLLQPQEQAAASLLALYGRDGQTGSRPTIIKADYCTVQRGTGGHICAYV